MPAIKAQLTPMQRLLQERLGENRTLRQVVLRKRRTDQSWDAIANFLDDETGIPVNGESLRRWYGGEE